MILFHKDAEDVTQEVFAKLYSSNITRENEEDIKAWLIRVTTNTCHSVFRNPFTKRRAELDEYEWEQIPDGSSSEQDYINRKTVMDAVMSLPEKYRILVYLYYYEISVGSDEVEIRTGYNVIFTYDGNNYDLLSWDNDLGADKWFEMASELLR